MLCTPVASFGQITLPGNIRHNNRHLSLMSIMVINNYTILGIRGNVQLILVGVGTVI